MSSNEYALLQVATMKEEEFPNEILTYEKAL